MMLQLLYAFFSADEGEITFSIAPEGKRYRLTTLSVRERTKYVAGIMEGYGGEQEDDVTTDNNRYACFSLRLSLTTLTEVIGTVRDMFVSLNLSGVNYRYGNNGSDGDAVLSIDPIDGERTFLISLHEQAPSFRSLFAQRVRGLSGVRSSKIMAAEYACVWMQAEVTSEEAGLMNRIAQLYDRLVPTT